jgi:phage gp29-like protein
VRLAKCIRTFSIWRCVTTAAICDALDRDYVGPLVRENFPKRYWHLMPHISFGEVELNDFVAWATAFAKLVESGLAVPSQFPHIWAVLGMPQGDLEEFYESLEVDDAILQSLMEPTVKADGTTEEPVYKKYTQQETGKRLTRNIGRARAGRTVSGLR